MQKIEITDDEVYEFFCPFCGAQSVGKTGIVKPVWSKYSADR